MILRKYQKGENKFELPVDRTKSETTKIINDSKNKQYLFKSLKDQALLQADKQLKRGAINIKEHKQIKEEIKSSTNPLDLEKKFEKVQEKLLRATKTPVLKNAPLTQNKEFNKEFFEKAEDKDRNYIGQDLLPNLGRAITSLATKGNLSNVPKNYELYKRYGINMPASGGYGDLVMTENGGDQVIESFNPFRSVQDLEYNVQDKDYGKAIVNAVGTLPLLRLTKPTAKLLLKAGETLRTAQPISTLGLPARLATNANALNRFVNLTGTGIKGAGYGIKYGADNVLDLSGFGGSNKLIPLKLKVNKGKKEITNINASQSIIKDLKELENLPEDHPIFNSWTGTKKDFIEHQNKIVDIKSKDYVLDKLNNKLREYSQDLGNYPALEKDITQEKFVIEGRKNAVDFIESEHFLKNIKAAHPELTDKDIIAIQKNTKRRMLSSPLDIKMRDKSSLASWNSGQYNYDKNTLDFRYVDPYMNQDPRFLEDIATHEFGHNQTSNQNVYGVNIKPQGWHNALSKDKMELIKPEAELYLGKLEEQRQRALGAYTIAKKHNLLENGVFTENTLNKLNEHKYAPDVSSILNDYTRPSALNYLNKFYNIAIPITATSSLLYNNKK